MQRLHVIGGKNHGKTQLVVELVQEFSRRGLKVGTIKHTRHEHELDTPGKDSHRHREAGAAAVGILASSMGAVFWPADRDALGDEDRYAPFAPLLADCDLVLVEGDSQTDAPKIEVWRAALGTTPLACCDTSILAVITDDVLPLKTPVHSRSNVPELADWILRHARQTDAFNPEWSSFLISQGA
jgi:molybdopterin-guanine dinucleotide biosynthesis protein MobB